MLVDPATFYPDLYGFGQPHWILTSNVPTFPFMCIYLPGDLTLPKEAAEHFAKQWEADPCYDLASIIDDIPELEPYETFFETYQQEKQKEWDEQAALKKQELAEERAGWSFEFAGDGDSSLMMVDYFAAHLLPRLWSTADNEAAAKEAYDMAEAMMRERSKRYMQ